LAVSDADMTTIYEYIHRDELFTAARKRTLDFSGDASCDEEYFYTVLLDCDNLEPVPHIAVLSPNEVARQAAEKGLRGRHTVEEILSDLRK